MTHPKNLEHNPWLTPLFLCKILDPNLFWFYTKYTKTLKIIMWDSIIITLCHICSFSFGWANILTQNSGVSEILHNIRRHHITLLFAFRPYSFSFRGSKILHKTAHFARPKKLKYTALPPTHPSQSYRTKTNTRPDIVHNSYS